MKKIIVLIFLFVNTYTFAQQDDLIPFRNQNFWGYSNYDGTLKIQANYDSVLLFNTNNFLNKKIAQVFKNNKTGIINQTGTIIIPLIYSEIRELKIISSWINALEVSKNKKYGIITFDNKIVIPIEYDSIIVVDIYVDSIQDFKGFCYYAKKGNSFYRISSIGIVTSLTEKEFLEYKKPSIIVDFVIDDMYYSKKIKVDVLYNSKSIIERNNDKIDSISSTTFGSDLYFVVYYKGKAGLVLANQLLQEKITFLIMPEYDSILDVRESNNSYQFLVKKDSYITVINTSNEMLMPLKYRDYVSWNSNFVYTKQDEKIGIFSLESLFEIVPKYDSVKYNDEIHVWYVKQNGKCFYINKDGLEYYKD